MIHDLQVYLRESDPVTYWRLVAEAKMLAGMPESSDNLIALDDPRVDEHLGRLAASWAVEELQHAAPVLSSSVAFAAVTGTRAPQGLHL